MHAGDGFVTQSYLVAEGCSDASVFFSQLLGRPYLNQFVVAPHIYCGDVSGNTYATTGDALWNRLTETFGYLTSQGAWRMWGLSCVKLILFRRTAPCMHVATRHACDPACIQHA